MKEEATLITMQNVKLASLSDEIDKINYKTDEKFTSQFYGKIVINATEFIEISPSEIS